MPVNMLHGKRGFAVVIKVTNQLTLKQGVSWITEADPMQSNEPSTGDKRRTEWEDKAIQRMGRF